MWSEIFLLSSYIKLDCLHYDKPMASIRFLLPRPSVEKQRRLSPRSKSAVNQSTKETLERDTEQEPSETVSFVMIG